MAGQEEFAYADLLPLLRDPYSTTTFRRLTADGVSTVGGPGGRTFLEVDSEAIRLLTATAMHDISHLLRTSHLEQLTAILDDPEASANDRFVASELLQNACIAAGGVLPSCQDTGTAIVSARKGDLVLTDGDDREAISRGVYDTFLTSNLRYSQ
ncbi:MAG: fumarate hydratase, partial [Actinomycetota bacterium]|nr:fumarate hydratase [Actinomycetota bacterium]